MKKKRISLISMLIVFLVILNVTLIMITPVVEESNRTLEDNDGYIIDREKVSTAPKLYFTGDMSEMTSKKDIRDISVTYSDENNKFDAYAKIKVQGTSFLGYAKKNYTITFYSDEEYEEKLKVDVGFGKQSKYCLKANWIDNTHARNIVSARLAAILQERSNRFLDAPNNGLIDGFPVEVYLNKEFLGLYTWNIPKDAWMWALDEDDPKQVVIGLDSHGPQCRFAELIDDWDKSDLEIEYGEYSDELKDNYNRLISFVKDSSDEDFVAHFEEYIDKESAINYALMLNVLNAIDNTDKNMMMVSYDQKIWYPSLYDLDTTFGTDSQGLNVIDYDFMAQDGSCRLWDRFTELFKEDIANRYKELRADILTKEYIMNMFEDFKSTIPESLAEKEIKKWPYAPGYDYSQIEEYLDFKLPYLDVYYGINI